MSLTLARLCGEWQQIIQDMNNLLAEQIIQDMNNLLGESCSGNQKAIMESRKPLRKAVEEIRKPLWKAESCYGKPLRKLESRWQNLESRWGKWQFWGLFLTPNLLPRARMDLLDWFFSFSTAHNFSFSNEVTLTLAFETITSHIFLRDTRSWGANPFTQQVTSPKQVMLGASLILGLSFLQASYPPWRCNSSSTSSIEDSRVIRRSWLKLLVNPSLRTMVVVS